MWHSFRKYGGSLGTTGSIAFIFERKGLFKAPKSAVRFGKFRIGIDRCRTDDFPTTMIRSISSHLFRIWLYAKALEERNIEITATEIQYLPVNYKELSDEQKKRSVN